MRNKDVIPMIFTAEQQPKDWIRLCLFPCWWITLGNYGFAIGLGQHLMLSSNPKLFSWIIEQWDCDGGWVVTCWLGFCIHQWSNESFRRHLEREEG